MSYFLSAGVFSFLTGVILLAGGDRAESTAESFTKTTATNADIVRFRLDPTKSTFMVNADRAGIAYLKGRSHRIAAKDFSGEASLSLESVGPASLTMDIKSASLEETSSVFNDKEKQTINGEVNKIVLETAKYPDITFKSTSIEGRLENGTFEVIVQGDITLHGVTRNVAIPATVTVNGDTFQAKGTFKLDRKKFGVNATEAFHGFVKVRHTLKFVFDIIGERIS